jgi:hypothetical protein
VRATTLTRTGPVRQLRWDSARSTRRALPTGRSLNRNGPKAGGWSTSLIAFVASVRCAARETLTDRPAWLERSVVSPLLGFARRPVGRSPPSSEGDPGHGAHRDRRAQAHPHRRHRRRARPSARRKDCWHDDGRSLVLLSWAGQYGEELVSAVEDCRHLSRRLERDLLAAGQRIVRVPPKLMANMRDSGRSYGKSDPIDALAVARAALREPDLPVARLDGPEREVRLLVDHREDLVAERTRIISRLRWHLHELDPGRQPTARSLDRPRGLYQTASRLEGITGIVARPWPPRVPGFPQA